MSRDPFLLSLPIQFTGARLPALIQVLADLPLHAPLRRPFHLFPFFSSVLVPESRHSRADQSGWTLSAERERAQDEPQIGSAA